MKKKIRQFKRAIMIFIIAATLSSTPVYSVLAEEIGSGSVSNSNNTDTPSTDTPSTDTPSTDTPSTDTPSTDTPSTDTPSTNTPSTDTPSTNTPSTNTPSTETPAPKSAAIPAAVLPQITLLSGAAPLAATSTVSIVVNDSTGTDGEPVSYSDTQGTSEFAAGTEITLNVADYVTLAEDEYVSKITVTGADATVNTDPTDTTKITGVTFTVPEAGGAISANIDVEKTAQYTWTPGKTRSEWTTTFYGPRSDTTEGITVAFNSIEEKRGTTSHTTYGEMTYTIPADFSEKNIVINAGNDIQNATKGEYLPGDSYPCYVKVINLSTHDYGYKPLSFYASLEDFAYYYKLGWATKTDYIAYDGQNIPKEYLAGRTSNSALSALLGKRISNIKQKDVTDEALDPILKAVKDSAGNQKYPNGIEDLNKYYIDFINDKKVKADSNFVRKTEISQFADSDILNNICNGYDLGYKETNPEVQEFFFDYWYNDLLSLKPISDKDAEGDYSFGSYEIKNGNNAETPYEKYCLANFGNIATGNTASLDGMMFTYDFWNMNNTWQGYNFGYVMGFELQRTDCALTVKYVDKDTNEEFADLGYTTTGMHIGDDYSVDQKTITDYEYVNADASLTGTMDGDKTITLYYQKPKYKLTVKYWDLDTSTEFTDIDYVTEGLHKGDSYTADEKDIKNYNYVKADADLSGIISGDTTINLYYQRPKYTVTINYLEKGTNNVLATQYVSEKAYKGSDYDVTNYTNVAINSYKLSSSDGSAFTGVLDSDKVINIYYEKESKPTPPATTVTKYTVTVNYLNADTGAVLATAYKSAEQEKDSAYDATEETARKIEGYDMVKVDGDAVTGTLNANKVINVYYRATERYTVTVNYINADTGASMAASYVSDKILSGAKYDVSVYAARSFEGYYKVRTTGDAVSGSIDANKVINVYYSTSGSDGPDPVEPTKPTEPTTPTTPKDIPDETVPLAPKPVTPETPTTPSDTTTIVDDNTPLADKPETPAVDIPEEDVPLTAAPQTGESPIDKAAQTAGAFSLAGLIATLFLRKRSKNSK